MRVLSVLLLGGVLAVSLARNTPAQTSTGSIRGYVTDSSGTPIAGARVIAVNVSTSAQREVATQNNGFYTIDRKSTRLNSSHVRISYAVFCLKKKKTTINIFRHSLKKKEEVKYVEMNKVPNEI